MNEMLLNAWHVLLELSPWLLFGALIAGILHVLVPGDLVRRHLAGRWGVAKAVVLGVPLPLCSCGVIPAGLGLRRDGASSGASIGFLISTPQTGVDSILVAASFLGWPFALFKVGAAAVTGLLGGWLADRVGAGSPAPRTLGDAGQEPDAPRSLRGLFEHAAQLLRSIWRWVLLGVLISAAIATFLPAGSLAALAGGAGAVFAALLALALSLPLYVCATASVPIAAALVAGGMPTGAALVFLMAGPATNVATIGAIYRGFGRGVLAVYLATLVVGSVGAALAFDLVLPGGGRAMRALHGHGGTSWWAAASAVGLLALIAWFAWQDARRAWRARRAGRDAADPAVVDLAVEGMTCGGCVDRLERALRSTEGVESAVVTLTPGRAIIRGSAGETRIREAIEHAGFRVA